MFSNATHILYIHYPLCAVIQQSELGMYTVSALRWRSTPCFCPFCGSPNYPVFVKNISLLVK